jgi:TonB-dependent receptor
MSIFRNRVHQRACATSALAATQFLAQVFVPVALGAVLLAPTALAQEQSGSIEGRLVDTGSGNPLNGVEVTIQSTGRTALSDTDGTFYFGNLDPGTYTLSYAFVGLPPQSEEVVVEAGRRVLVGTGLVVLDTVVITGARGAQAQALSEQRGADNLRNVISADQAGRFADVNVAESLRRVPGLSVQREGKGGDGRYVSIRGLDSGLNNFQINGMNVAQPEEENRRAPLDVIQTGALSKITVNKTLLPDNESDGIGGAIVLETATAFDYSDRLIELEVSGYYSDLAEKLGPKVAGTYADRFGSNDQFGILLSGSYSRRDTFGYVLEAGEEYIGFVDGTDSAGLVPFEFGLNTFENERENTSFQGALSWEVDANTELNFKASYNKLFDTEVNTGVFFEGTDEYDEDGNLLLDEGGTVLLYGEFEETEWTQNAYVFDGTTYAGAFVFDYGIGYSEASQNEPNDYEVTFETDVDSNLLDYSGSSPSAPFPLLSADDLARISDPANFELGGNDIDADVSENQRTAANFDVTYSPSGMGALQFLKAGVKVERSEKQLFEANVLELEGPLTLEQFGVGPLVDYSEVSGAYSSFLSLASPNLTNWRAYANGLLATNPDFENAYAEFGDIIQDEDTYDATEDTFALYGMAKFVFDKWDVIGGLRIDHARIKTNNLQLTELEDETPVLEPIENSSEYTKLLPRIQVNYRASDDLIFRGAVFTSIARPAFVYISGSTEIVEDDGEVDITVGNADLKPSYAWNADLGVEYYFDQIGVVSANVFYKRIEDFIFNEDAPESDIDPTQFLNDPRLAGREIDDVFTFVNGNQAEIYGLELNLVRQFTELLGALGGLGVYANMTLQNSKADSGLEGRSDEDFFNAPDLIYTAAATYQKYGLEGSLAYSWRDSYVERFADFDREIVAEPYGSLDGQLSYAVTGNAKIFVNAIDMLGDGEPINDFRFGDGSPLLQEATYRGRSFMFGVNLRY